MSEETITVDETQSTFEAARNAAFGVVKSPFTVGTRVAGVDANGDLTTALGHKPTKGHRHVAEVWGSKLPNLPEYTQRIKNDHASYFDAVMPLSKLILTDDFRVQGPATINEGPRVGERLTLDSMLSPTASGHLLTRAFPQATKEEDEESSNGSKWFQSAPKINTSAAQWLMEHGHNAELAGYIRTGISEVLANVKQAKERGVMLRNRESAGETITDAVLSERYGRIDNDKVMDIILDKFPKAHHSNLLASHAHYDGRNMNLNILVPDLCKERPDSEYGVGISVKNSETGKYALSISAFLFRAICVNGCIWDKRESEVKVHKMHMGNIDFAQLALDIEKVIQIGLSEGNLLLGQFDLAHDVAVPNPIQTIAHIAKVNNKITTSQSRAWYEDFVKQGYENTAFGVVNALTESAQRYQGDVRTGLESIASNILTPSLKADIDAIGAKWARYNTRAQEDWISDEKAMRQYVFAS